MSQPTRDRSKIRREAAIKHSKSRAPYILGSESAPCLALPSRTTGANTSPIALKEVVRMTLTLKNRTIELTSDAGASEKAVADLMREVTGRDEAVKVTSLKGGITNQLLLAEQAGTQVLVRAFGKGTDTFIDREREFAVHTQLQKLGLAPKLFCQFGNGLMYGFVPGEAAEAKNLDNEYIMEQVSHRLAQWHATLKPADVAALLTRDLGDFWAVLEKWVSICPSNVLPLSNDELFDEFRWLKATIADKGGPEVMGHCDLLSANILLPENNKPSDVIRKVPIDTSPEIASKVSSDVSFIDYEYAIPCTRAFDLANHFQEWQGYECAKERVPEPTLSSPKLQFWCKKYLSAFELLTNTPQDLGALESELQAWWGMPGFYWGVWSAIQSKSSVIDFGYFDYAGNRFSEYLEWKRRWKPVAVDADKQ